MEDLIALIIIGIVLTVIIYFWIKLITVLADKYKLVRQLETLLVLGPTIVLAVIVGFTYPLYI